MGWAPDLFYNSTMESCIVILNANKKSRKNKVIFINAADQIERCGSKNRLRQQHIENISTIFKNFQTVQQRSYVATNREIQHNKFLLQVSVYVQDRNNKNISSSKETLKQWQNSSKKLNNTLMQFARTLRSDECL